MNVDHFCTIKEITIPQQLDQGRSETAEKMENAVRKDFK